LKVLHKPRARRLLIALASLCLAVAVLEALLRVSNPELLQFSYRVKQPYRFHERWYVDFEPSTSTRLKLDLRDGSAFYDFRVTIGADGFRIADDGSDPQQPASASEIEFIHCIGDSFTMGWGVDYDSSYPALLSSLLGPRYRVLNLGLNGFGVVGATEKSLGLWTEFPAAHVVYLFYPNDLLDDANAQRIAGQGEFVHAGLRLATWLRQRSYAANLPFAARYDGFRRRAESATQRFRASQGELSLTSAAVVSLSTPAARVDSTQLETGPSFDALDRYAAVVAENGATLTVLVYSNPRDQLDLYRDAALRFYDYARCRGLDVYLVDVPGELRLPFEGHNSRLGNERLALRVHELLSERL